HCLADQEASLEVHLQHAIEVLFLEVEEVRAMHDSRIVDENVDIAKRVDGRGHEIMYVQALAHIRLDEQRFAKLLKILDGAGAFLRVDIRDDDAHSLAQEALGYGIADAAGGSRNDRCLPVQCHDLTSIFAGWKLGRRRAK